MKNYPILILGAGINGASLAKALALSGFEVKLFDAMPLAKHVSDQTLAKLRCSALVPQTVEFLNALGVWNTLSLDAGIFRRMQIWYNKRSSVCDLEFCAQNYGAPALGYIVENVAMQFALNDSLENEPMCEMIRPVQIESIQVNAENVVLIYRDNENAIHHCVGSVLVAADGARSWVRNTLNFDITQRDYDQTAIVTTVKHQKKHENIARQIFLKTGPLAFLPCKDAYSSSIVWTLPTEQAHKVLTYETEFFCEQLCDVMMPGLGKVFDSHDRIGAELQMIHAKDYCKPRVILLGDAAHTVHPLAGQGLNLGIADAKCLLSTWIQAREKRRDLGALDTLRKFERERKTKNLTMLAAIESCQRVLPLNEPLSGLLASGVSLLNRQSYLKNIIIKKASWP